jgi:hypothetical protein
MTSSTLRWISALLALAWAAAETTALAQVPFDADPDPDRPTLHVQPPALNPVLPASATPIASRSVNGITIIDVMLAAGLDYGFSDYGNEPALTANPVNPSEIVLTSFSGSNWAFGGNSSIFYSSDAGASWTYSVSVPPPPGLTSPYGCPCDQTMDWGRDGRLYGTFLYYFADGTSAAVFSAQSTSPTLASSWVYPLSAGSAQTTNLPSLLNPDQPWLWTGPTPTDVTATGVAVAYDNFDAPYTHVEVRAASSPGFDPLDFTQDAASNDDGQAYNDGMNAGNRLAVGPDGKIFGVYQRLVSVASGGVKQVTYLVTVSTDGGQTFGAANSDHLSGAKIVSASRYSFQGNGSKIGGVNALLGGTDAIAVDPATGTAWIVYGARQTLIANDRLFLVPVTYSAGNLIVGTARAITPTTSGAYLPAVAVLPNGEVGVLYLSLSGSTFSWQFVQTTDGGATLATSTTLSSFTSPFTNDGTSNQRIFGDYVQLRAVGCSFYGAFAARGAGTNSVSSIDPYFMNASAATTCNAPTLTGLTPSTVCAGGPSFALALAGTGFANGAVGRASGSLRDTAYGSPVSATMTVDAADIAAPGVATIDFIGAVPAGGLSGSLPLTIDGPAESPGATLVAARSGDDVRLDWAAAGGASSYNVRRCNSTAGPCSPETIATPSANTQLDPIATDPDSYWYLVEAVNSCGATP